MQKWILVLLFFLSISQISAQRFGGTPPGVKWKQINTDTARIIFAEGLDSQAMRVASLVHHQAAMMPASLGNQLKKINIVLQNQTVVANGYVGQGPFRSEFYLNPPTSNFDQGSIGWADQLALHEYRHVQQYNNFNNGISRLMRVLFGQEGYALATNASIPEWFFEGDAVYMETKLTAQGRGRLPLFMNAYPTLWRSGKKYSWMKVRNGSWKDYVPDHYHLGYLLVNYGYEKYGDDFWAKVTRDASAFKGLFYPFQKAISKHAGIKYSSFRTRALEYYREKADEFAKQQTTEVGSDATNVFPVEKNFVTHYLFPYQLSPDTLLYLKRSFQQRPAFYTLDANGEHKLRFKDISLDDQYSYRNGKIVYAAYENDPRWQWRDYSVIKLLDVRTKKSRTLTKRTKYFTPDISPSGQKIIAARVGTTGSNSLHLLDASTGDVEKEITSPVINLFTDPKFFDENTVVSAARYKNGTMALVMIDLGSGALQQLTPASFHVVGYPFAKSDTIYFTASFTGSDNLYALALPEKKIYRLAHGLAGNYFVNAINVPGQGERLMWSEFSEEGFQFKQLDSVVIGGEPVEIDAGSSPSVLYPVGGSQAGSEAILNNISSRRFPVSQYRKSARLLNFHSWRPYYEDPEFSFSLYGQNILNTLETELYYLYNQNDNTSAVGFNGVFGGWFPYINAGTQYTFRRQQVIDDKLRSWDQLDTRVGLSVPLSFTRGQNFRNLIVGSDYVYRSDRILGSSKADFANSNFSYLSHRVSFSQQVESAVQHIFPRLGFAVSAQHRHAITKFTSWQFLGSAALYLPGIAPSHNLVLSGSLQERDTINILFGNRFAYSRGFNEAYASRMWRGSANYHFPLLYPDWGFANILYFHRLRANAFFDFTRLYSNNKSFTLDQQSIGAEIYVDTKWWNQYELSFGVRISRLLNYDLFSGAKETVFEFILPVSIFPR